MKKKGKKNEKSIRPRRYTYLKRGKGLSKWMPYYLSYQVPIKDVKVKTVVEIRSDYYLVTIKLNRKETKNKGRRIPNKIFRNTVVKKNCRQNIKNF